MLLCQFSQCLAVWWQQSGAAIDCIACVALLRGFRMFSSVLHRGFYVGPSARQEVGLKTRTETEVILKWTEIRKDCSSFKQQIPPMMSNAMRSGDIIHLNVGGKR